MNTADRLRSYYDFDDNILGAIETTAAQQNSRSFNELADEYGLSGQPLQTAAIDTGRPVEYYWLHPRQNDDHAAARVLFAPMAIPADKSMAMRAMRLFGADPTRSLLVIGSPSIIGNRFNIPAVKDVPRIWKGDMSALAQPAARLLSRRAIERVDLLGYSYGADVAAAASSVAVEYDIATEHGVLVEPASIANRGIAKLLKAFASSGAELDYYVEAADSLPLRQARSSGEGGALSYFGGLARASNIAIAHTLARDGFESRLIEAHCLQPGLRTTVAWGSASEITNPETMANIVDRTNAVITKPVSQAMELRGMHHAGGDDIDLHAAIMLQGLRRA